MSISHPFLPGSGRPTWGRGYKAKYPTWARKCSTKTLHLDSGTVLAIFLVYWLDSAKLASRRQKSASHD